MRLRKPVRASRVRRLSSGYGPWKEKSRWFEKPAVQAPNTSKDAITGEEITNRVPDNPTSKR